MKRFGVQVVSGVLDHFLPPAIAPMGYGTRREDREFELLLAADEAATKAFEDKRQREAEDAEWAAWHPRPHPTPPEEHGRRGRQAMV